MTKSIIKSLNSDKNNTIGALNEFSRLEWLEKTLKQLPAGSRILDAGAGELAQKKYCAHLDYVSQDFAQYNGQGDNSGLQTKTWDNTKLDIVSDITAIPEPDASFDAIMCIEVFEHLPDPVLALKEFARLLKKGGALIITAPFCSLTHFAPYHFSSGFNRYYYEKHLPDCGFMVDEISPNGNYFEYLAQEVRRVPGVAKRYSDIKSGFWERINLNLTLRILAKYSSKGSQSSDLLCFGYHVKATRK